MADAMDQPAPDRALALGYAPADRRAGLEALFALDATLGDILRTTREPVIGQMRLTWWFEALERLDREPSPAQPVLQALAAEVLPRGVTGSDLSAMIDGWETVLVEDAPDDQALVRYAADRGGRLFGAAAVVLGATDPQARTAGEGWALADLSANLSRPDVAERARALAAERLRTATEKRWSRAGRALGGLAWLARYDLEDRRGPERVARLLLHRLTGR
ncbi:MAG TPA: squalene/phytoene synthase family protein [Sphingomonas sp.]|jgi:phytoene synthase